MLVGCRLGPEPTHRDAWLGPPLPQPPRRSRSARVDPERCRNRTQRIGRGPDHRLHHLLVKTTEPLGRYVPRRYTCTEHERREDRPGQQDLSVVFARGQQRLHQQQTRHERQAGWNHPDRRGSLARRARYPPREPHHRGGHGGGQDSNHQTTRRPNRPASPPRLRPAVVQRAKRGRPCWIPNSPQAKAAATPARRTSRSRCRTS